MAEQTPAPQENPATPPNTRPSGKLEEPAGAATRPDVAYVASFPMHQVTRTESGLATRIMRFNALTAIATSPCWAAKLRARSFDPTRCLYRPIAVSTRLRLP